MNNKYTKETFLQHWALLEGAKAKIHKYIAREDTGRKNKRGNNVYRYFYSQSAYDAFKNKAKQVADKVSSGARSFADSWMTGIGRKNVENFVDNWLIGVGQKTKYESVRKAKEPNGLHEYRMNLKLAKDLQFVDPSSGYGAAMAQYWRQKEKHVSAINPDLGKESALASADRQRGPREPSYKTKSGHLVYENTNSSAKWIAKVKLTNGKTRYFYDAGAYSRWKEIQTYQDDEPEFMKKYKEIEPSEEGRMPAPSDDYTLTNDPNASPNNTVNCIYCTAAYELRRRGYDVEAIHKKSEHSHDFFSEVYQDSVGHELLLNETGTKRKYHDILEEEIEVADSRHRINVPTIHADDMVQSYLLDFQHTSHVTTSILSLSEKRRVEKYYEEHGNLKDYPGRSFTEVERALIKDMPNGTRGAVACMWNEKMAGHAFVWEKDDLGNVSFYDPQINKKYSDDDMERICTAMDPLEPVVFVRTDDLTIKPDLQKYFQERGSSSDNWAYSDRLTRKEDTE